MRDEKVMVMRMRLGGARYGERDWERGIESRSCRKD